MMTLVCCTSNLLDGFLSENNLVLGETPHQSFKDNHTIEQTFKDGIFHGYLFVHWVD